MATRRIREFLDGNHARYVMISHSPAYTTSQVAESAHVPGRSMAKAVIVVLGGRLAMAVVPSTHDVDLERLREETGQDDVRLADEEEFDRRFEGCKLGAAPPFGSLFGLDTYLDRTFAASPRIAFNAGTHTDVIEMGFSEYYRLARPKLVNIAVKTTAPPFHIVQF